MSLKFFKCPSLHKVSIARNLYWSQHKYQCACHIHTLMLWSTTSSWHSSDKLGHQYHLHSCHGVYQRKQKLPNTKYHVHSHNSTDASYAKARKGLLINFGHFRTKKNSFSVKGTCGHIDQFSHLLRSAPSAWPVNERLPQSGDGIGGGPGGQMEGGGT